MDGQQLQPEVLEEEVPPQALAARQMRLEQRMAYGKIAEALHCTEHTVIRWAKAHGFHEPIEMGRPCKRGDEFNQQLAKLWELGLSTSEIGRRLGVTKNSVVGLKRRLRLPDRPSPIGSGGRKPRKRNRKSHPLPASARTVPQLPSDEATGQLGGSRVSPQPAAPGAAPAPFPGPAMAMPGPEPLVCSATATSGPRERSGCCFPLWPHGARSTQEFCGRPVLRYQRNGEALVSRSYCPEHYAAAFRDYDPQMPNSVAREIAELGARRKAA